MDSLSSDNLEELYATQIQPGAVFFISHDSLAQKDKFVLILGIDEFKVNIGTLFINSKVNSNVIKSLEQQKLQYKLKASTYNFLEYDSYINASMIHKKEFNEFLKILIDRHGIYQGQIEMNEFDYLRSLMAESPLFSMNEKRQFGLK